MTSAASSLRQQARRLWHECSRRRFSSESTSTSSTPSSSSTPSPSSSASSESSKVPGVALLLGATGAVPFLALAPQVEPRVPLLPRFVRENAAALQVGYGVAIASFLGGIHWGLAASGAAWGARTAAAAVGATTAAGAGAAGGRAALASSASRSATAARYLWSVTPCLLAWPATALVGEKRGADDDDEDENEARAAGLAAATLAAAVAVDAAFASRGLLPPYLMKLRVPLSAAAVGGLALRAADAKRRSEQRKKL